MMLLIQPDEKVDSIWWPSFKNHQLFKDMYATCCNLTAWKSKRK